MVLAPSLRTHFFFRSDLGSTYIAGSPYGWFAPILRYANNRGLVLGRWLPPFGSTG
jgi:hypothetical protein